MGSFLLILFLIFIVWPLVRTLWKLFTVKRQFDNIRRQARQAYSRQFGGTSGTGRQQQYNTRQHGRRGGKKIASDVGEYVSFEELPPQTDRCNLPPRDVVAEEQVVDVEWEDIK